MTERRELSPIEAAIARLLRSLYVQEQAERVSRRRTMRVVKGGKRHG